MLNEGIPPGNIEGRIGTLLFEGGGKGCKIEIPNGHIGKVAAYAEVKQAHKRHRIYNTKNYTRLYIFHRYQ